MGSGERRLCARSAPLEPVPIPSVPSGHLPLIRGVGPGGVLLNPSLLPAKPSEAGSPGRGGARERTQFSPPGGNGVEWTLRRRAAMGKVGRRRGGEIPRANLQDRRALHKKRSMIAPSSASHTLGTFPPGGRLKKNERRNAPPASARPLDTSVQKIPVDIKNSW